MPGQGFADETFEALFRSIGGHAVKYPSSKFGFSSSGKRSWDRVIVSHSSYNTNT